MKKTKKRNNFLEKYFSDLSKTIEPDTQSLKKLYLVKDYFISTSRKKGKILIFGNGGSSAIASHVSVDLTKNARIRTVNYNESDLITCFSNDYGYENWVQKALSFNADKGDMLICISSSGNSKNIINGAKFAKKIGCKVITLTGFDKKNKVRKIGDVNLWVDSKNYNIVEMTHHIWLLTIVDYIARAKFNNKNYIFDK